MKLFLLLLLINAALSGSNYQETVEQVDKLPPFIPQQEGELRGACPFLNTLTNHGILPRSGSGLTKKILVDGLTSVGVESFLASVISDAGVKLGVENANGEFVANLEEISKHGKIEHDASLTRPDYDVDKSLKFNATTFELHNSFMENGKLTVRNFAKWRNELDKRCKNCKALNDFGALGEGAFLFQFLGDEKTGEISREQLETFLVHEKMPDYWGPLSTAGTAAKVAQIKFFQNFG